MTEQVTPTIVTISPSNVTLNVGEVSLLSVQATGGTSATAPAITCASSNASVASVTVVGNQCRVLAVAIGNTSITATANGASASSQVTVSAAPAAISGLTLSSSMLTLAPGQTFSLVPNVTQNSPAGTTGRTVTYTYGTSAPTIATVANPAAGGTAGVITAVAPGTAVITVTATGSANGFSQTVLTQTATVTVTALPSGITSLSVIPTPILTNVGLTTQLVPAVVQPTGAGAVTYVYGSANPSVATVSTTGLITALAPGSAVITVTANSASSAAFAATSVSTTVPVTVQTTANVTIQDVRQGPIVTRYVDEAGTVTIDTAIATRAAGIVSEANGQVNQPIDINNVRDQIQILVNLNPNGQRVDSVVAYISNADGTNRQAAARQVFSGGSANAGDITMFVNTADFTADFTAGTSMVRFPNGTKTISVGTWTTTATGPVLAQNAANFRTSVTLNNLDGYALQYTNPTRSATNPTNGFNWFGGPGTEGQGSASVVPVFYTPGRSLTSLTLGMRQGTFASFDVCNQAGFSFGGRTGQGISSEKFAAGPFRTTYNSALGRMDASGTASSTNFTTAANGNIECFGYTHPAVTQQNIVGVIAGIDNNNNPAPLVTFANGYRFATTGDVAVVRPVANRLDYAGPSTVQADIRRASPAVTGWVNATFNFASATEASTDAGVGTAGVRSWFYQGAGSATSPACSDTNWVAMASSTGADIPECATNLIGGWDATTGTTRAGSPYVALYTEVDRLQNASTSPKSARFGVDRTMPVIRWSTASRADTAVVAALSGATSFQAEFIDERGGFVDGSEATGAFPAPTKSAAGTIGTFPTNVRGQSHFASRAGGLLLSTIASKAVCINPSSFTSLLASNGSVISAGATFQTAPACAFNFPTTAYNIGQLADGYLIGHPAALESREGIYHYATRVTDRAGNTSEVLRRRLVAQASSPELLDIAMPAQISASAAPAITFNAQDSLEIRATSFSNRYTTLPTATWLRYPQTLVDARFNDVVNSPIAGVPVTTNLPLPHILGVTSFMDSVPRAIQTAGLQVFNPTNRPASLQGSYLSQGVPTLNSFNTATSAATNGSFTWSMLPTRDAGFNAPEGLKAQLVANTNTQNQAFVRVDFFRLTQTTTDDPYFGGQNWQYLGSATTAAVADVGLAGTSRAFTFTLSDANLAARPTSFETKQSNPVIGEQFIAIGVRANGAGLVTGAATLGGTALGINVSFVGTPAGQTAPLANIAITGPGGFTATATGTGAVLVPTLGSYTVTANNVSNAQNTQYICSPSTQNVTVANTNVVTAVPAITCTAQVFAAAVAVTGLGTGESALISLAGPANASASLMNTTNSLIPVTQAGSYTVSAPTTVTGTGANAGLVYTLVSVVGNPVTVGAVPSATAQATVTYAQSANFTNVVVTSPLAGFTITTGGTPTTITTTGTTRIVTVAAGATTITAPNFTVGGVTYGATIVQGATSATGGTTATVTYAAASATLSATGTNSANGTNPSGYVLSTRITGPTNYDQTFSVTVNGPANAPITLPVPSAGNGSYTVLYPHTFLIGGTTFTSNCATYPIAGGIISATVVGNTCQINVNASFGSNAIPVSYTGAP
ncbi:MAG TPA: Ig-like domain-containing protein [Gemmatimonas sp.]|nr:Ig-like domain-containing protein [Gemmatimonas sp.]